MSGTGFPLSKILLVKTSSLGDVIHNLPVVSDLQANFPGIKIDWVVEESFAAIPRLHPGVTQIIPVALRRWRKNIFNRATWKEISKARGQLAATDYDVVLDTQGLLKSALISRQARGKHLGHNGDSAREPLAARFYDTSFFIPKTLHAVERNRRLAAAALGYFTGPELDYGIQGHPDPAAKPSVVLLTATSRDDKLWPETHWVELGRTLAERGLTCLLPGGSTLERERALRLAKQIPEAQALPPLNLTQLADLLAGACVVIGVDTGLSHLAAALKTPTLALYTATEPGLTGVLGSAWHRNLGGKGEIPSVADVVDSLTPILSLART